ncbi:MAG TPA: class D sortase [Bellilinea sp.]|nr:class D sortase [Bellilinea sp.]
MTRRRSVDDLSADELRRLLVDKRRADREIRLERYRRSGRVVSAAQVEESSDGGSGTWQGGSERSGASPKRKTWLDHVLLFVEIAAVIGLGYVLFNGVTLLRDLNKEVTNVLVQPTLTPTAIIQAVVLPSGHTPPNSPEGVQFNEAEIPEHLRPLVQTMANLPLPTPSPQQAVRIQIPALDIDAPVVQGDGWEQLKKGVAQHPGTADPGQNGNVVLSAHNDVFGEIFRHLDRLQEGDEVIVYTNQRAFVYVVKQTQVVEPTQVEVMAATQEPVVTLISCYPYLIDDQRIVVTAFLEEER